MSEGPDLETAPAAEAEVHPPAAPEVASAPAADVAAAPAPEAVVPAARPIGTVVLGGAIGGALAAAATGLVDGVWSWDAIGQFVPDFLGRARLCLYLALIYGVAGLALGAAVAAIALIYWRWTRLGDLGRAGLAAHRAARARDPRTALPGMSLALAGLISIGVALLLVFRFEVRVLANRQNFPATIAAAIAVTLGGLGLAVAAAIPLARAIEHGLAALPGAIVRRLAAQAAPFIAILVLILGAAAVALGLSWETMRQVPLRGPIVAIVAAVFAIGTVSPGLRIADRARTRGTPRRRAAVIAGSIVAALIAILVVGGRDGVIKAATSYSGLGGPLTAQLRRLGDWDRDGYARWLGGGDCDDGDAAVHPGAVEIPDDGIDQNCVGGDATARRTVDPAFVPVPATVPADTNIVLITIDTLRADHLHTYGYDRATSPTIDKIASEGTRFANAWAHAPSTRYSMPAILTGRYPLDVRYDTSISGWPGLLPEATTIAELLKARGFATGAVTNYWYFDESRRMNQGFDSYDNTDQRLHSAVGNEGPAHTRGSSSKEQSDKAIAFIDAHVGQRFFLWVHYYDPHFEYEPHREAPRWGDRPVDLYDQEIFYTDLHLGRLVAELEAKGLWGKTAIVVTGDHGEGFGEHGVIEHGYHLYAAQTRVPLIVRIPGLAPRVATTPAGHVDIMPTLADLAGGTPSPEMMGRSLLDVIAGGKELDRPIFQQLSYEDNHEMRAAATGQCHVIYNVSPHTSWEIYRVDQDPMETHDLVDDPGPCADTQRALEAWYDAEQVPAGAGDALLPGRPDIGHPRDLELGDSIRLLAVDMPAQVARGKAFTVTWTFEARGTPPPGWKVFAHFEDPTDPRHRFTGDHAPVRPFEWWQAGQFIRYTTTVQVPAGTAPGRYTLWTGLWKGNDRQPIHGAGTVVDNRADVGAIEVTP
jgi:arylsulfatase A-like enzyme